jgi:ABC-type sugar transport system ATPase subunit
MVYVTHDQEEAMKLGDRIVVMRDGCIEQAGSPGEVYAEPATLFVARFVGSPPMNVLGPTPAFAPEASGHVAGIRPRDVVIVSADAAEADVHADIDVVEPLGHEQHVHLAVDGAGESWRAIAIAGADVPVRVGERVGLRFPRDRVRLFDGASGRRVRPAASR